MNAAHGLVDGVLEETFATGELAEVFFLIVGKYGRFLFR